MPPEQKAEALMRIAVTNASRKLMPRFEAGHGRAGFVCAQVNPMRAGDRECMFGMARRFHAWAPNIAVKLPATAAGLDVLEECVAEGMTDDRDGQLHGAAGDRDRGTPSARRRPRPRGGHSPGKCFAVIMIGRLDDYLREVAQDGRVAVSEADICQAGLAVAKRAYPIYKERGYEAVLLVAALRGTYHLTELAGADLLMSIHPAYQEPFVSEDFPREERIDSAVPRTWLTGCVRCPTSSAPTSRTA